MIDKGILLVILIFLIVGTACHSERQESQHSTWEDYGGGPDNSRYVKMNGNGIDRTNVDQLQQAWFYPTGDNKRYQFNPVVVDTVMYVLAHNNSLVALDARTGKEIWIHADLRGIARRGINYWESKDGKDKRLLFQMNDYLEAINAKTGKSILSFGDKGLVDLKQGLGRDPSKLSGVQSPNPGKVYKNLLILGSAPGEGFMSGPGHIRAYNVVTGKRKWIFHTIPQPGEFGYDTWPKDAYKYVGGVNTWGEITVDKQRDIVYLPLGSPTNDYYGADRIGKGLFGTSLVALDAKTGELLWYYQLVHHDLWDYDPTAAPQLITVHHKGKDIDAVALAGKTGFLYVFNRVTGEPLWPIKEKKVPPSHVPGEKAWPTQPFPTKPKPFARQGVDSNLVDPYFISNDERAKFKKKIKEQQKAGRAGFYTPLSTQQETVALPGAQGGANWGGTAANPEKGMVYIISKDDPSIYPKLTKHAFGKDADSQPNRYINPAKARLLLYKQNCQTCHGVNQEGKGSAPSLKNIETRLSYEEFQQIIASGPGEMPAFSFISKKEVEKIYRFLGGTRDGAVVKPPEGPVVASGGAPGGQDYRQTEINGGRWGSDYPKDADAPSVRYYIPGWGLGNSKMASPPWQSIIAYDLNKGVIKWRRPLGTDKRAVQEGAKEDTGTLGTVHKGMIVTSTGLVFATAGDGNIYAFDANSGKKIWQKQLPNIAEGLPTMYKIEDKYYLVVTATNSIKSVKNTPQKGYIVFSLPKK